MTEPRRRWSRRARPTALMAAAAQHAPDPLSHAVGLCAVGRPRRSPLAPVQGYHADQAPAPMQNVDRVAFRGLPAAMLGHCTGAAVLPRAAAALEVEILQALNWRLGPFLAN